VVGSIPERLAKGIGEKSRIGKIKHEENKNSSKGKLRVGERKYEKMQEKR
jgi:hypothetical protein